MKITLELTEDQLAMLSDRVAETLARKQPVFARPLTVGEFSRLTGLSEPSVYRLITAQELRTVSGLAKKLIPAAELERFQ